MPHESGLAATVRGRNILEVGIEILSLLLRPKAQTFQDCAVESQVVPFPEIELSTKMPSARCEDCDATCVRYYIRAQPCLTCKSVSAWSKRADLDLLFDALHS